MYFQCDSAYVAVTHECPKGFKGIVFISRGTKPGGGLDEITEQGFAADQIKKMRAVQKADVPPEWVEGLGYEKPEPAPIEEEPVLDNDGDPLDLMPVCRQVRSSQVVGPHVQSPEEIRNLIPESKNTFTA